MLRNEVGKDIYFGRISLPVSATAGVFNIHETGLNEPAAAPWFFLSSYSKIMQKNVR